MGFPWWCRISAESGPLPLAALRIAVALCWWVQLARVDPSWAGLPVVAHPFGIGWLEPWMTTRWATAAWWAVVLGSVFGLLGVGARAGFGVVALGGVYLLAMPQLLGGTEHTHHLVWFAALLAVSPASDALTLGPRKAGRSRAWGVPTRVAWLLIVAIYFFPGLHKFMTQGFDWAGDSLRFLLYWKWAQAWDFIPLTRIDASPLLWIGGVAVLVFEIGCGLLLWNRCTRFVFVLAALVFHASTAAWFDIHFWHLAPCLVVLLPFPERAPSVQGPWWLSAIVGAALLVGVLSAGLTGTTQGWPFACYPTFERPVGRWMPTLQLVGVTGSGEQRVVPERALADGLHSKGFYRQVWAITGHYGVNDPIALELFWEQVRGRPEVQEALGEVVEVRIYRAETDVVPGSDAMRRGPLLWETVLGN